MVTKILCCFMTLLVNCGGPDDQFLSVICVIPCILSKHLNNLHSEAQVAMAASFETSFFSRLLCFHE